MKKKYIIIICAVVLLSSFLFLRNSDEDLVFEVVQERELVEEVFESGTVKSGEMINLSFRLGGIIDQILISEGDDVFKGGVVASLEKQDLISNRRKAQKQLEAAGAELMSVKEGGRVEDIESLENRLEDAEEALEIAERALSEAQNSLQTSLNNTYSGIPSLINEAYLLSKSLKDSYKDLRDKYFVGFYLQETYVARNAIRRIELSYEDLRNISREITTGSSMDKMDKGLSQADLTFSIIEESIETIIDISETDFYERRFSDASKEFLWESRDKVSKMDAAIVSAKGEIKAVKETGRSSVTSAESNLSSARARQNEIEDSLKSLKLGGRDSQVKAAEARVEIAREDLVLAQRNLERTELYSPVDGKITDIHYKKGEEITPITPMATVLTNDDYHIRVHIYEGDITSVEKGNKAAIELVPFPGQEFSGEVFSIKEIGELIDGVVYYEAKISIDNVPEGIMPEMTADATIETSRKETISLPREAIRRDGSRRYVRILKDDQVVETDIEVGISDSYGFTQITSGLSEGDRVIVN